MSGHTGASVLTYGLFGDVRVADLVLDELARPRFTIHTPWGTGLVELSVSGAHMASNAAAAIAVAGVLGVPLEAAIAGVGVASLSAMRMELTDLQSGAILINDAYNANPTSMRAAVDALAAMQASRRVAVLGLMAELDDPVAAHREIAEYAAAVGVDVVAVGTDLYGIEPVVDPNEVLGPLGPGDVVLVKASRAAGLDLIAGSLLRAEASRSSE